MTLTRAMVLVLAAATTAMAQGDPTAGTPLAGKWLYSVDAGKTYAPEAPKLTGRHAPDDSRRDAVKGEFVVADPAAVGLLKVRMAHPNGAFTLTDANSVDRYNVGACPVLLEAKITLNGKATDLGHEANTLYRYFSIRPEDLKKGVNTIEMHGKFWHKNYGAGAVACDLQVEVIPTDRAVLDRLPVLGMIGEDYFGLACRAVIPSRFVVAVSPLEPAGAEARHAFGPSRECIVKVPLPKGVRKFRYSVTVSAGGSSKTYGPYDARGMRRGTGLRFVAAGGTATYREHFQGVDKFLEILRGLDADFFVHTGNYQNCTPWDFMWTEEFLAHAQPTLASVPMFATANITEMMSPGSFARTFYFPPDNGDWARWTVAIGNVRLVALEAFSLAYEKGDEGARWLEQVLKDAREDYVLVFNAHTTGTSPTSFDEWYREGLKYTAARVDPLLLKYRVTATIGNIHRCYQRVDPPADKGVPTILTGKAGGLGWPLRTREVAHSKALSGADHYLLFEVKPDGLEMKAIDFDGKVIDSCTFRPRK